MIASNLREDGLAAAEPGINRIDAADLDWALRTGWQDFRDKRGDLIFVPVLYPLVGLLAAALTLDSALLPIFFPLVAGLSILGPVAASGFYEIARRREVGDPTGWSHFFDPLRSDWRTGLVAITLILVAVFVAWLSVAWLLYRVTLGRLEPVGAAAFFSDLFNTREGWMLIILGNAAGGLFAVVTLVLTVVSVPLVVDKRIEPGVAIQTSIRAVAANPAVMARWGATVAVLLVLGSIPLFIGLAVALPVLGYATWHLYTRVVQR